MPFVFDTLSLYKFKWLHMVTCIYIYNNNDNNNDNNNNDNNNDNNSNNDYNNDNNHNDNNNINNTIIYIYICICICICIFIYIHTAQLPEPTGSGRLLELSKTHGHRVSELRAAVHDMLGTDLQSLGSWQKGLAGCSWNLGVPFCCSCFR